MKRDAHAGLFDHRQIVGTIAHGERIDRIDVVRLAQVEQRCELGRAAEDRLGHRAGELAVLSEQFVGAVLLKADALCDHARERREAA